MNKPKKQKYAYGTVRNYMESPEEAIAENDIAKTKAKLKSETNPFVQGLNVFGNMAMNYGTSMMGKGIAAGEGVDGKGITGFLANNKDGVGAFMKMLQMGGNASSFAMGGEAGGKIEAEGDEVVETPDGQATELKGPKHEQGGIDLDVPAGTTIYSDRILIEGKSIAERKKARESKLKTLESRILKKGSSDKILEDSFNRTKQAFDNEEKKDLHIQGMIGFIAGSQSKAMFGLNGDPGITDFMETLMMLSKNKNKLPIPYKSVEGQNDANVMIKRNQDDIISDGFANPERKTKIAALGLTPDEQNTSPITDTFGNMVGIFGNLISTFGPMKNTLKNRASDTPNVNSFKDFGNDGLKVNEEAQGYVEGQRELANNDIDRQAMSSKKVGRNSARGINQVRALDLSTDMATNQAKEKTYATFAQQMMNLLGQKSQMENQQDQVVMQGEKERDDNDRRDKDNFYTQMAQDISTMGTGLQQTGKDLNQAKQQDAIAKILSQLNKYGVTFDENYNYQNPKN